MPTGADFEAGRTIRIRLGDRHWVYVDEREARIHEILTEWPFVVVSACMLGAVLLVRRCEDPDG